jgi:hypothetical protein
MLTATPVKTAGKAVALQDPHGVRREEPCARPGLDVGAAVPFHDEAVDPAREQEVPEYQAGGPGAQDDHVSRIDGRPDSLTLCHEVDHRCS